MAKLDELLRLMRQHKASDIHLSSGSAPYLRVHGEMVKMNYREVAHELCQSLIFQILTDRQKEIFNETLELDFGYPLAEVGRFRVNVFMQRHGIAAVFRLIEKAAIAELGRTSSCRLIDVYEAGAVTGQTARARHDAGSLTTRPNLRARHTSYRRPDSVRPRERQGSQPARVSSHTKSSRSPARRLREAPTSSRGRDADLETMQSPSRPPRRATSSSRHLHDSGVRPSTAS